MKKEHSNLEDKKRLMESYRQMMDKALEMIEKRGTDLTLLETMAKEHRLVRRSAADIEKIEQEMVQLKADIEMREATLFQYQENKNKLFGSVAQGFIRLKRNMAPLNRSVFITEITILLRFSRKRL